MSLNLADLLGEPAWAVRVEESLARIEQNQEILMATVSEALQGWTDYTDALKAVIDDLNTQLTAANETIQQLKDTDAAEDAAQAQQLTDQIAQQISDALAAAQAPPPPPVVEEPVESPDPETVEPPASEEPSEESSSEEALTGEETT